MAFNSVTDVIVGNLGKVNDLRELKNDNAVLNFSVAVTPQKKQGKEWVDDETIWTNCVCWGRDARAMAANEFKPGTQLIIIGTRRAVRRDAYTSKNGTEVPSRVEQEINVSYVGVAVNPFTTITVEQMKRNGNGSTVPKKQASASQGTKQTVQKTTPADTIEDPFASSDDDPFADKGKGSDSKATPSNDDDDPFADIGDGNDDDFSGF